MIGKIAGTALLAAATVMPVRPAAAQNPVGAPGSGCIRGIATERSDPFFPSAGFGPRFLFVGIS